MTNDEQSFDIPLLTVEVETKYISRYPNNARSFFFAVIGGSFEFHS